MKKFTYLLMLLCTVAVMGSLVSCSFTIFDCEHTQLVKHEAVAPDCTTDGTIEYYECAKCHRYFRDSYGLVAIDAVDTIDECLGHNMVHHEMVSDCLEEGNIEYYQCKVCHKYFTDLNGNNEIAAEDIVYAATGHDVEHVEAVAPTCLEEGNKEYWYCNNCDKYYADEDCTVEVEDPDTLVIAPLGHSLTHYEYQEPTCGDETHGTAGHCEYWYCENECCHAYFWDEEAELECDAEDVVLPVTDEHEHLTFVETSTAPTVEEAGENHYTCDDCGADVYVPVYKYHITDSSRKTAAWNTVSYSNKLYDSSNNGTFVSDVNCVQSNIGLGFVAWEKCTLSFDYYTENTGSYDFLKIIYYEYDPLTGYFENASYKVEAIGTVNASFTYDLEENETIILVYLNNSGTSTVTMTNINIVTEYEVKQYEIAFDTMGGEDIETMTVYDNVSVTLPEAEKEGYFFDGWYTDPLCQDEFDAESGVDEDTVLYAKYTKGVTVSFANTGDTEIESVLVRPNTEMEAPETKPVYNDNHQYFAGWFYDMVSRVEIDFSEGFEADATVYALWRDPVTLTFEVNGGSEVEEQKMDINVAVEMPEDPTKDHARFVGWYNEPTFETEFDPEAGITEDTTIYAYWIDIVYITYDLNGEAAKVVTIDKGTKYTAVMPEEVKVYNEGLYTASDYATAYPTTEQTIDADTTIYVKEHDIDRDPEERVATYQLAEKAFTWNETPNTYTGTDATWTLTFAVDAFVVLDYASSGLSITVNGESKLSVTEATEAKNFYMEIEAGNVVVITATAETTISNLCIYNGYPQIGLYYEYRYGSSTTDTIIMVYMGKSFGQFKATLAKFVENAKYDGKGTEYKFAGFYHDAEFTKPVEDTDMWFTEFDYSTEELKQSTKITLYVYYSTNVTLTFETVEEDATDVDPINVWTREDLTTAMPDEPELEGHKFVCWKDSQGNDFDPAKGVEGAMTLTAYFEEIPEGGTKEYALVVGDKYQSGKLTTTKVFDKYFVKYVSTGNDYVYIDMPAADAVVAGGAASDNTLRNLTIEDKAGKVVAENITKFPYRLTTEAGQTYYFTFNLGNKDNATWGDFKFKVSSYDHDSLEESQGIPFNSLITISGVSLIDENETYLFTYTATATTKYRFNHSGNGWSMITIYSDAECTKVVTSHENKAGETTYFDFDVEEGATYYVVVSQNWSNAEKAKLIMEFKIDNYPEN